MAIIQQFIECTSLSITYDIMGIATVNYVVVFQTDGADPEFLYYNPVTFGNRTFDGYVSNMDLTQIPETENWYECRVTLITTTD